MQTATATLNAIAEQAAPPNAAQTEKIRRPSRKIMRGCELLINGDCRTIKAAAERVGMSREWLSRCLQMDHVRVFVARRLRGNTSTGAIRASARLVELIDAGSEHVSADVSKWFMAVEGIKPAADAQVSVNIDIKAGYVIDISADKPAMRDVTPHATD